MCIIYAVCTAQSMCLYLLYSNQQHDRETIRCDQQLTEQLDHHICSTSLETNWTADEFQNSLMANRGDKSRAL